MTRCGPRLAYGRWLLAGSTEDGPGTGVSEGNPPNASTRQVHLAQQFFVTRIAPYTLEQKVSFQPEHSRVALSVSATEPCEREVLVT